MGKVVVNSLPDIVDFGKGTPNLCVDITDNILFQKDCDPDVVAFELGAGQQPNMVGGSIVQLNMNKGSIREPHWHTNAWQLNYLVHGHAIVTILNPTTGKLTSCVLDKPGLTTFIPMGWLHWITSESNDTQLLLFFNNTIQTQELSEMFGENREVFAKVFQQAYNFDPDQYLKLTKPLDGIPLPIVVGPPCPKTPC